MHAHILIYRVGSSFSPDYVLYDHQRSLGIHLHGYKMLSIAPTVEITLTDSD